MNLHKHIIIICVFFLMTHVHSQTIGPWNVTQLKQTPSWTTTNVSSVAGMTGILYESINYLGNPVEVFAYYSAPSGTPPAGGWPAVVYVSGGLGHAIPEVVQYWNQRGYAAISMDTFGQYPNNTATPNPGPARTGVFNDYQLPIEDQWYYHAVAQVVKANSLLRSFPEINANKIGLMGTSWGGSITGTAMGLDNRLAWALPVYGCGYLDGSDGSQGDNINSGVGAKADVVMAYFDGSLYFDNVTFPTLFLNRFKDSHFDISQNVRSSRAVNGPTGLVLIKTGWGHGNENFMELEEPYIFVESVINGGVPLPEVGTPYIMSGTGYVNAIAQAGISSASMHYTNDGDNVELNEMTWATINANVSGNTVSANIPAGAQIIIFEIEDSRGLIKSSEYIYTSDVTPPPGGTNLALNGTATQSTTLNGRGPELAIDGNTNGNYGSGSVTVAQGPNAWWEVDLGGSYSIDDINVFNRTNSCCVNRLSNFTVSVEDGNGNVTFSETITSAPNPSETIDAGGAVGQIVRIQSNLTDNLNLAEVEVFGELASTNAFVPDPNKTYYIDCPQWNLRLAASGESEDAYTTSTSTTGADVEWKFVSNGNGYWHLDRAAGGTKPRLRTDGTADADMNQTAANGTNTYYSFSEGNSNGTFFLTLPDGTVDYNRLQIDNTGAVKMTGTSSTGSWVSFTITETAPVSCATFSRIQAENYNSMSGVVDEGINIGFIENGDWAMYSNIDLTCANSIDVRASSNTSGGNIQVRLGSPTGTLIGTVPVSNTGGWGTYATVGSTVSSVSGTHDVYLVFTGGSGFLFNLNWVEFDSSSSKTGSSKTAIDEETSDAENTFYAFPNPVADKLHVQVSGSKSAKLEVINFAGQRVLSYDIKDTDTSIDVSKLASGIYILKVTDENTVQTKRIIKK